MRARLAKQMQLVVNIPVIPLTCISTTSDVAVIFVMELYLVAEWIHFTLFWIILPTIKLKVYTFWGL